MPRGEFLGEFEQIVLLAVVRLDDSAYGIALRDEIELHTGREVSVGSVYKALDRMEKRGLVVSTLGDPTPERGGRAKRFYSVELPGVVALHESRVSLANLWAGLDLDPDGWPS